MLMWFPLQIRAYTDKETGKETGKETVPFNIIIYNNNALIYGSSMIINIDIMWQNNLYSVSHIALLFLQNSN